jgi:KaiC/GvpD/RAD55 family RecA-like ATPase
MALDAIKSGADGALVVLVDTETSKENVSRAATSQGWRVGAVSEEEGSFRLDLVRE